MPTTIAAPKKAPAVEPDFLPLEGTDYVEFYVGTMYAAIGEHEKALAWLEKSYTMRQADLVSMKIDPPLDSLRNDKHFRDLLRRVHLTE